MIEINANNICNGSSFDFLFIIKSKIKNGRAGYYEDDYLHSFFGYAPAFNAEFLVFLYLKKPQGTRYASNTLTEPFMNLMKFLLNYYEVPPDR